MISPRTINWSLAKERATRGMQLGLRGVVLQAPSNYFERKRKGIEGRRAEQSRPLLLYILVVEKDG